MQKPGTTEPEIPAKRYFRIGEVSAMTGLESYVLRFWETEFKGINPKRTDSGQRLYRRADVELIHKIKHLLHEKRFTIQGAKQYLNTGLKKDPEERITLAEIRSELLTIRDLLTQDAE